MFSKQMYKLFSNVIDRPRLQTGSPFQNIVYKIFTNNQIPVNYHKKITDQHDRYVLDVLVIVQVRAEPTL